MIINDHTQAYLQLIERVSEDGELSNQEIYQLAKWLNENPDGRKSWPGNVFLPLLKQCFADGKIEVSEARAVAKLIQLVRREWARANAKPMQAVAVDAVEVDPVEAGIADFDDSQPLLPLISRIVEVSSLSEPGVVYNVDLAGPYCDCPDFASYRSKLPEGHISRCCKHVMQAYSEVRPETGWPSWLESFLEAGFRPQPAQKWQVYKSDIGAYLVSSAHPAWGNVYARFDHEVERFGYSIDEDRWSYGKEPVEGAILAELVRNLSE